jgi:hypothetical protein
MLAESLRHFIGDLVDEETQVVVSVNGLECPVERFEEHPGRFVLVIGAPPGHCRHLKSTCWECFMVNGVKE